MVKIPVLAMTEKSVKNIRMIKRQKEKGTNMEEQDLDPPIQKSNLL